MDTTITDSKLFLDDAFEGFRNFYDDMERYMLADNPHSVLSVIWSMAEEMQKIEERYLQLVEARRV